MYTVCGSPPVLPSFVSVYFSIPSGQSDPILHHTRTSSPVKSADRNVKDKTVTFLEGMHNLGIEKSPLAETAKAPTLRRQEDGCIPLHSSSQLKFIKRCH